MPITGSTYRAEMDIDRDGDVDSTDQTLRGTTFVAALPKGALSTPGPGSSGGVDSTVGWSGYRYDQPTRLYAVRFRYYDAVTFRWLNRDPAGYVDSMNLYGYGFGSGIGWSDPFGLGGPSFATGAYIDGDGFIEFDPSQFRAMTWDDIERFYGVRDPWRRVRDAFIQGVLYGAAAVFIASTGGFGTFVVVAWGAYGLFELGRDIYLHGDQYTAADWLEIISGAAGGALGGGIGFRGGRRVLPSRNRNFTKDRCFIAGTLVATALGLVPIEQIEPGDLVWSFDTDEQSWVLAEVVETYETEYLGELVSVTIASEDRSVVEQVTATANHPFWVVAGEGLNDRPAVTELPEADSRPTASGRWTEARHLQLGDKFLTRTGQSATVVGLTIRLEGVCVYNLHVCGSLCYGVSTLALLVHNACGETPHTIKGREKHRTWDYGPGFIREYVLPSGRRIDAFNPTMRQLKELKPNNPRQRREGRKNLERYRRELQDLFGGDFECILEVYD